MISQELRKNVIGKKSTETAELQSFSSQDGYRSRDASNTSPIEDIVLNKDKGEEFVKDAHAKKFELKDSQTAPTCNKDTDVLKTRDAFQVPAALRKKPAKDILACFEK